MKKNLKIILIFLLALIFICLLTIQFGPGYQKPLSQDTNFDSETFFSNLQNITGEVLIWPSPELYQRYQSFFSIPSTSFKFQTYEYPNQFFRDSFQQFSASWANIQLIIEDQKYQQFSNPLKQLQSDFSWNANIEIKSDQQMGTTYVHSKISLSDTAFRIQSANLTTSSYEKNREHFFTSENAEILDSLHQLFDNDWNWNPLSSDQFHPNLVVCPTNCRAVIEAMLSKAEHSIIIQTQYIFDESVLQILRQKSEQLDLKIIVADTIDNTELTHYFWPKVARKLTSNYNHTKMILIDEKYLLLWSMNLSANSLDNNREIWIMLLDPELIQTFLSGFLIDRKENTK